LPIRVIVLEEDDIFVKNSFYLHYKNEINPNATETEINSI